MIVDKLEHIGYYPLLAAYEDEIKKFVRRMEEEFLEEGRYDLNGDKLFALVQRYETKEKAEARMESHKIYADIQYIHEGEEMIFVDFAEDLIVQEDKRISGEDILFYEKKEDKGGIVLSKGMFGYYGLQDAHMPCIKISKSMQVVKIVFKLKLDGM